MKRLSLRWRITLLCGAILLLCAAALTAAVSKNAEHQLESILLVPVTGAPQGTLLQPSWEPAAVTGKPVTEAKKDFNAASMAALAVISVLGTGAVYLVSGRALEPIRDLSRQAAAISQYNLHERVPEAPCAAEIDALRQSFNAMLDRLDGSFRQQKQFSANVAHELKTPLAIMSTSLQVLRLEQQPDIRDCEKVLAVLERNTRRLEQIVENLTQLCLQQPLQEAEQFDLSALLAEVCEELAPEATRQQVAMEQAGCPLPVRGNRSMLRQALYNLLENAIKYNHPGGSVRVSAAAEGRIGRITVRDTGVGIPPEALPRIFEPFYRVDGSRSRRTGGSGLGLSVVKQILEHHGWTVSAESSPDRGSAFVISCYLEQ